MSKIICLSGFKQSGKDTAAAYLVDKYNAERLAFADPLKDMAAKAFGVYRHYFDDPATKEMALTNLPVSPRDGFSEHVTDFMIGEFRTKAGTRNLLGLEDRLFWTPRALAILLGSTMRTVDPDYWVRKAVEKTSPGGLYVISDCRYRNEVEALKRTGANVTTVRINRFDTSPSDDPSERDLDNYEFDYVLSNRNTIEDLHSKIADVMADVQEATHGL